MLIVEDIQRSRVFYETILGQKVIFDYGENITFEGSFSLHLKSHYEKIIGQQVAAGKHNFELYFENDDMDQTASRIATAGIEMVHPLKEQPWRQKVLRCYDPDRHIVEIGESLQHLSFRLFQEGKAPDEIGKIISMPESFVLTAIKAHTSLQ